MSHYYSNYRRKVQPANPKTTVAAAAAPSPSTSTLKNKQQLTQQPQQPQQQPQQPQQQPQQPQLHSKPASSQRSNSTGTRRKKRQQRPSLSEQLASIGSNAEAITNGLRERHGMERATTILFTTPALLFVVGRLESKAPSPVEFHQHHCSYSFQHPYQTKTRIDMTVRCVFLLFYCSLLYGTR